MVYNQFRGDMISKEVKKVENNEKKEVFPVSIRLDKSIAGKLENFCNKMRMSRNSVIINALEYFFKSDYAKKMLEGKDDDI